MAALCLRDLSFISGVMEMNLFIKSKVITVSKDFWKQLRMMNTFMNKIYKLLLMEITDWERIISPIQIRYRSANRFMLQNSKKFIVQLY